MLKGIVPFSCMIVLGVMFWHMRVSTCAPESHVRVSKLMTGFNHYCVWVQSDAWGIGWYVPDSCVM